MRAFDPFPGATVEDRGSVLKLWRAQTVADQRGRPGEVLNTLPGALIVACGVGALELLQLQRPGGRRLPAAQCFPSGAPPVGSLLRNAID